MKINWKLVLVLFIMFLLFTDGAILGNNVRSFITWVASGWDAIEDFFTALTGQESSP